MFPPATPSAGGRGGFTMDADLEVIYGLAAVAVRVGAVVLVLGTILAAFAVLDAWRTQNRRTAVRRRPAH
jgi:hypothetical protein